MIIPAANNVEYGTLICSIHAIALSYEYPAYRRKHFESMLDFSIENDEYSIVSVVRDIRKERKAICNPLYISDYKYHDYKKTLDDFIIFLEEKYSIDYPEIMI